MASICCVRLLSFVVLCALYAECALLLFVILLYKTRVFAHVLEFCSFGSSEVNLLIGTSQPRNCVRYQFSSACYNGSKLNTPTFLAAGAVQPQHKKSKKKTAFSVKEDQSSEGNTLYWSFDSGWLKATVAYLSVAALCQTCYSDHHPQAVLSLGR